jgi:hypothetical protein
MTEPDIKQEGPSCVMTGLAADRSGWTVPERQYEDLPGLAAIHSSLPPASKTASENRTGSYVLDAGSGPIQYPEYLTYSEGYKHGSALIFLRGIAGAASGWGEHGLYVVADVAHLPFRMVL